MPSRQAPRHGTPYENAEIALLYLVDRSDSAKSMLAVLLGRTEDAIDMVWRWIEHAEFPSAAHGRIARQVEWAEHNFGARNRGVVRLP